MDHLIEINPYKVSQTGGSQINVCAIEDKRVGNIDLRILGIMGCLIDRNGDCRITILDIAGRLNVSQAKVNKSVLNLIRLGFIVADYGPTGTSDSIMRCHVVGIGEEYDDVS